MTPQNEPGKISDPCTVCGAEMIDSGPSHSMPFDPKARSVRCPNLEEQWHKDKQRAQYEESQLETTKRELERTKEACKRMTAQNAEISLAAQGIFNGIEIGHYRWCVAYEEVRTLRRCYSDMAALVDGLRHFTNADGSMIDLTDTRQVTNLISAAYRFSQTQDMIRRLKSDLHLLLEITPL